MYLKASIYISKYDEDLKKEVNEIRKLFPEMFKSGNLDSVEIGFEVGYWRKVNHIHRWFVENCQDGRDECQNSYVSRDKLKELLVLCEEILKDKETAKDKLPSQEGFFFGGTDYDEWYFKDLKNTIKIIKRCLKLSDKWEFIYRSSW